MKKFSSNQILSAILCFASMALAAACWISYRSKGFPDGHLTELDRAEQPLLLCATSFYCLASAWFASLGLRQPMQQRQKILIVSIVIGVVASIGLMGLDIVLNTLLDNGRGG